MQTSKPIVLFDIDYVLFDTAHFKQSGLLEYKIYGEVLGTLENLNNFVTLGIFSKGEMQFQQTKLEKTGIAKFFKEKNIHIFDDKNIKLTEVLDKYQSFKMFLVDDKLEILYLAKKHLGRVFTVWVKRGEYAENQKPIPDFKADFEVANLSEVVRIVQSNL
jgi:FMN phosphatase YigB (HAD superfamily)